MRSSKHKRQLYYYSQDLVFDLSEDEDDDGFDPEEAYDNLEKREYKKLMKQRRERIDEAVKNSSSYRCIKALLKLSLIKVSHMHILEPNDTNYQDKPLMDIQGDPDEEQFDTQRENIAENVAKILIPLYLGRLAKYIDGMVHGTMRHVFK